MSVSTSRIILHYNIHDQIELMDLTVSFNALASIYRKHLVEHIRSRGGKTHDIDVKLYITKIENNCILAELAGAIDILGTLFSVMDYTSIFHDFVRNLNTMIEYFRILPTKPIEKITPDSIQYNKKECGDVERFLNVVAKSQSKNGQFDIGVAEYNEQTNDRTVSIKFTFTTDQAFEARKGCLLAQDILEHKSEVDYAKVLMYFEQTNTYESKSDGKTSELAVIKTISDKALPVYIVSTLDRERIFETKHSDDLNPMKVSYLVDVNVETDRNNKPRQYRIVKIHKMIPDA